MKALLGAFGDPGHAFPMLALGRALRARGHDVLLQTGARWQVDAFGVQPFGEAPGHDLHPVALLFGVHPIGQGDVEHVAHQARPHGAGAPP